jgi:hypothetical protein
MWIKHGGPAQPGENIQKFLGRGAGQGHGGVVFGMAEGQGHAGQQQPVQTEIFAKEAVLAAVAAQHVSDERVADVGEVAADLMGAPGFGVDPEQAVTRGGVGADRVLDFRRGQAREFGAGFLQGAGFGFERVVDEPWAGVKPRATAR